MELSKLNAEQWLAMLPCKIYNRKENKSYLIISVTKNGLYYHDTTEVLNDDFSISLYNNIFSPSYLLFDTITSDFELGIEPTEKQIQWLTKNKLMNKSMTKQEAWKIINEAYKTLDLSPYYTTEQINSILNEAFDLDVW